MIDKSLYYPKFSQKLKVIIILILSFLFCQNLSSQFYWQKTYARNNQLVGNDACQTTDGNFVITGATLIANHGYSIFLMKINGAGDTLWTRTVPNAPNENDISTVITETNDGGVVIAGRSDTAWTCKFDVNGNLIWYKKYLLFFRYSDDIITTSDNGFIICGYVSGLPSPAFIFKIDSSGNLLWEKTFLTAFIKEFYSIAEHDSGFVLTGYETISSGSTNNLIIFCLNNQGDSLWQKNYKINNNGINGRKIIKLNNNYYIGSGTVDSGKAQLCFLKTDFNGDTIFTKKFSVNGRNNYYASFNLSNNRLIFAYERDSTFGLTNGVGMITDTNGNIISKRVFTNSAFVWGSLRAIVPINNSDLFFAGTAQLQPSTRVVYALRTDSLLNAPEYIGINNISSNVPEYFKFFQNYPNPFNSSTKIKFQLNKSKHVLIEIYDINGKFIEKLYDSYLSSGLYETIWESNNLSSGFYFVRINIGLQYSSTIKIILLK